MYLSVMTKNITSAMEHMKDKGYEAIEKPSSSDGVETEVASLRDPDGYTVLLVNEGDFFKEIESS